LAATSVHKTGKLGRTKKKKAKRAAAGDGVAANDD
jgi:hypothetical protein